MEDSNSRLEIMEWYSNGGVVSKWLIDTSNDNGNVDII